MEAITENMLAKTTRSDGNRVLAVSASRCAALARELGAERRIRRVKGLDVYSVTADEAPSVMEAIGRIRETEYRKEGGGTGKREDIDAFDLGHPPYRQLVVWDAQEREIVAAYRYIVCRDARRCGQRPALATECLFEFSDAFRRDYLPYAIELGRSVVNRRARRRFLGLFAAWAGVGALLREHRDIRYLFGKVTTYPTYNVAARDLLLHFFGLHCPGPATLVRPRRQLQVVPAGAGPGPLFTGSDYAADYAALRTRVKELGELIPPAIISYLALTATMQSFGTARNAEFGDVDDTAILVTVADINHEARARFIDSYERVCPGYFCAAADGREGRIAPDDCAVTGGALRGDEQ
jgi:hypothetical protein